MIERLEQIAAQGDGSSLNGLLQEVSEHPELREGITEIEQINHNAELVSRLVADLFPAALTLNEIKAVSVPYRGLMFNYTERFKNIIADAGNLFEINIRNFDDQQFYIYSCCLILNYCYNTKIDLGKPLFYDIPTQEGFTKHYRILYNGDFLEIFPAIAAPLLTQEDIKLLLNSYDNLALWMEKFPPASWIMKGFTIVTLFDATVESAVSLLKGDLLTDSEDSGLVQKLESIFGSIFKVPNLKMGFTSFNEFNGKLGEISMSQKTQGLILNGRAADDQYHQLCRQTYESLIQNRPFFAVMDIDEFLAENQENIIVRCFKAHGIKSFILAPVIKQGKLLGFLELASPRVNEFNSVNANKLEVVMPFLTDAIERRINELKNRVHAVIQNNYTTLHPSVNWKFENEAHNFITSTDSGITYDLKEIKFQNVYPLYGQVDIQNSSVTRNLSVQSDLKTQISRLIQIVRQIDHTGPPERLNLVLAQLHALTEKITKGVKADSEQQIQNFFEIQVHTLFRSPNKYAARVLSDIETYFRDAEKQDGVFYRHRRNYETTLAMINARLVDILDRRHQEIQQLFPHYYERFKTDGVEHNLYIGESIYPGRGFNFLALKRLRLWQLLIVAEQDIEQRRLKKDLPYQLAVTSLILVFGSQIDIRFRMDEKHFDVDGAYDIRYEIIKKRIDKAHIKDTDIRITEKEKLTIVFSKEDEINEYRNYIQLLQKTGVFNHQVEEFEIEDLQGVSGLKGLRVGINYTPSVLSKYDTLYKALYEQLQ